MSISRCAALALLLTTACDGSFEYPPPPHAVYLADVPEADRHVWEAAVDAWNKQVHHEVLYLVDEAPRGAQAVYVKVAQDLGGATGHAMLWEDRAATIRYLPGRAWCVAAHELGHVLGLPDEPDNTSVMAGSGCTFALPNARNGHEVRELWGLE